jgi:two-component SAPR family response regulator
VQELHPETKVLFISGYTETPTAQTLIAQGDILLQKPVLRGDLMRKVDEILHLRTLLQSAPEPGNKSGSSL